MFDLDVLKRVHFHSRSLLSLSIGGYHVNGNQNTVSPQIESVLSYHRKRNIPEPYVNKVGFIVMLELKRTCNPGIMTC